MKIYAKCNLSLNVVGRRADGYHELDMVVCSVSLYDEITLFERRDRAIICDMDGVRQTSNAALSAAVRFRRAAEAETGPRFPGWTIRIKKGIPFCAGLGGSSADAAGVLKLLEERYPGEADIFELSQMLGSDTTFMLEGGFARMRGRGEQIEAFACPQKLYFVFLVGEGGVSTADAFSRADEQGMCAPSDNGKLVSLLRTGDLTGAAAEMKNGLFAAATSLNPEVGAAAMELKALHPLCVNMTGSGSAVYALFDSREAAESALARVRNPKAFLAETVSSARGSSRYE